MTLPDELLDLPAPEAVRHVALGFLDEAAAARERLGEPEDSEALHDFRVAIRRLRSTVRAYPRELEGSVSRKAARRLRRIARATGASRDAEVQLEWLEKQRPSLYSRHRPGAAWLLDRLRRDKIDADAVLGHEVTADFDRLHAMLRASLPELRRTVRVGEPAAERPFAPVVAERVRAATSELGALLASVTSPLHIDEAHESRIAAKRVRYLIEPFADRIDGGSGTLKRLKKLQDILGEMHDLDVLGETLAKAIERTATEHARELTERVLRGADDPTPRPPSPRDPRPGLVGLARRLRVRRDALYADAARDWLAGNGASLLAELDAVAASLDARAVPPRRAAADGVEIERKFLLTALPPTLRDAPFAEIDQGWLPGERLVERVRRTRRDGRESHARTVKVGAGLTRLEIEEPTTPELFAALWPLTRTRRVRKRRYAVADGDVTWEIDAFADRDLVLAEVELASADQAVTPPEWLAPYVVRDVTEEPAYVNVNLARADDA